MTELVTKADDRRYLSMTNKQKLECNAIIHTASISAGAIGAGLAQVPGSDNTFITPIQMGMAVLLAQVFGISLNSTVAKATCASTAAATMGRTASQVLCGWIPGVGNVINAGTAATVTEAIGWAIAHDFERQANAGVIF